MNIDDLVKLASLLDGASTIQKPTTKISLYSRYVGKYVICRTRNEGINAGKVLALDETGVILEDARRLYYHKPASKSLSWYEGVAIDGLSSDSRVGAAVEKLLVEDFSLTLCSDKGEKSIRGAKDNEQS